MENDSPGGAPAQVEDGQATPAMIEKVLESLLSKKNLVSDQFLAGNMNPQMYIPIRVLMAHEKVVAMGASEEAVIAAATASTRLGIDDAKSMVRPLLKSKRNVIILRDMPDTATEEEIKSIFANAPHAEKLVSVKPEVNNAWFVKFKLDEGTQDVVLWLRTQQFQGQPINASIKSEHFLRSFFPINDGGMQPDAGMQPGMGFPMDGGMGYGMGYEQPDMQQMMMNFEMMKGKGKGMMPMQMPMGGMEMPMMPMGPMGPNGPQPPGSWQPWGKRHQPPPMILPLHRPEKVPESADKGAEGVQKGGKGKGKGAGGGEKTGGGDSWGANKWGADNWDTNSKWGNEKWGNDNWDNKPHWAAKSGYRQGA